MQFKRDDFVLDDISYTDMQVSRQIEAFHTLNLGASNQPVYGGEYKDMKERLSRLFDDALKYAKDRFVDKYRHTVTVTKDDGESYTTNPDEIDDVLYKYPNLTQLTGYIKFLDKMDNKYKADTDFIALHELAEKWNEVGLVVKGMKDSVIKGKRPPAVKSDATIFRENMEAQKKTCPCCIAKFMTKKDGTMVHHGYKRPGWGMDIGECMGAQRFKPLEESLDGTYYMVEFYEEKKAKYIEELEELPYKTELIAHGRQFDKAKHKYVEVSKPVYPPDGRLWKETYDSTKKSLEAGINGCDNMIHFYQDVIKNNLNKTYPKDNPQVSEEREKYLKIVQSFRNSAGNTVKKGIVK